MFTVGRLGLLLLAVGSGLATGVTLWDWFKTQRAHSGADSEPKTGGLTAVSGQVSRLALLAGAGGGWVATGALAVAFATSDWRFAYVSDHARPDLAWPLRVGGLWAGPEGSLLLWSTMAVTAAVMAAAFDRPEANQLGSASGHVGHIVAAAVGAGHSAITLVLANPFEALAAPPAGGTGLQPVLEHPAMVWHPPILYAGLIALMIPAGLVLSAAAFDRKMEPAARQSMLWALALLTLGLATGANWAYVELGWGGYWAWDPIENAGLVAWLTATSMIHRVSPGQRPRRTVAVLAMLPAVAALWATTITRTGVLSSVHSFADQPGLRTALLTLAAVITISLLGATLATGAGRTHPIVDTNENRRRGLVGQASRNPSHIGAWIVLATAGLVAVGTYQPAFTSLLGGEESITGPSFYATVLWPLVVVGAVARIASATKSAGQVLVVAGAVFGALTAMAAAGAGAGLLGLLIAAAGGAVVGSVLANVVLRRSRLGSSLAHLGIGVLVVGIGGAMASSTDTVQVPIGITTLVEPGNGAAAFDVLFQGAELEEGDGIRRAVASVTVAGTTLEPALVSYVRSGSTSVETATHRGWLGDIQVSLVDADSQRAVLRVSHQPRMALIWLGASMITLGFVAQAVGARSRPVSRRRPTTMAQGPTSDH